MNSKKARRTLVCECGRKFRTSRKFNNEKMCNGCYARHSREFLDWFGSLTDERQSEALAFASQLATALGVTVPATEEQEQARIDAVAASLLADVEIDL